MDNTLVTKGGIKASKFREVLIQRPDIYDQVRNYTMLGATELELAEFFGVDNDTWLFWVFHSAPLRNALEEGGIAADAKVAAAMYRRAVGYDYKRQRLVVSKAGEGKVVELDTHVPADVRAGEFWLTNRSKRWANRSVSTPPEGDGTPVDRDITITFVSSSKPINVTPRALPPSNDTEDAE